MLPNGSWMLKRRQPWILTVYNANHHAVNTVLCRFNMEGFDSYVPMPVDRVLASKGRD